ncbi:MAG: VOC family protein [Ilumatobacteraceae bacterium]
MSDKADRHAAVVPARVTLVTLAVADVARATTFYESLGWHRSSDSNESVSFFQLGGLVLSLFGVDDLAEDVGLTEALAPDAGPTGPGLGFRGFAMAINFSSTAEVDQAFDAWTSAGGVAVKRPVSVFWGGYSSYVGDLDGNLWELAYNPGWPLQSNATVQLPW